MGIDKIKRMKELAKQAEPNIKEKHLVWVDRKLIEVYLGKGGKR